MWQSSSGISYSQLPATNRPSTVGMRRLLRAGGGVTMTLCLLLIYMYYWASTSSTTTATAGEVPQSDAVVVDQLDAQIERANNVEGLLTCFTKRTDNRKFVEKPLDAANASPRSTATDTEPIIYFVTPTYPRREQFAELTRLGQTLMHVPNLFWIVADDNPICNNMLDDLLLDFGIPYTHLASPMPEHFRSYKTVPRGVANRKAALSWIKKEKIESGVLYFGDDDNSFNLKLFPEIRDTKVVSMFPVGLIGKYAVSAPVVKEGKVVGFFDSWPANRRFPVDMAGFAVNLAYLSKHPKATMPYKAGHEEDEFLKSIHLQMDQIEPKANGCTEIWVWHTRTTKEKAPTLRIDDEVLYSDVTSLGPLMRKLDALGVSFASTDKGLRAEVAQNGKGKSISSILS